MKVIYEKKTYRIDEIFIFGSNNKKKMKVIKNPTVAQFLKLVGESKTTQIE